MKYIIHTDGGARGNPGTAAVGVVIEMLNDKPARRRGRCQMTNEKPRTTEISKRIGETTNNVAEYTAVLEALRYLRTQNPERNDQINFYLDSTLVVNQLNGLFKVKDAKMRALLAQARILEQEVGGVITYTSVSREQNTRADFLVNKALDEA